MVLFYVPPEAPLEVASCLLEKWDDSNPDEQANIASVDDCIGCFAEVS